MFKQVLEEILERTSNSIGALIMGTDGIAVEQVLRAAGSDMNLDVAAAEFTSLVRSAQRMSDNLDFKNLHDMVLTYDTVQVVIRTLTPAYFLVLALDPDGSIGHARFELRKAEMDFAREFAI